MDGKEACICPNQRDIILRVISTCTNHSENLTALTACAVNKQLINNKALLSKITHFVFARSLSCMAATSNTFVVMW